MNIYILKKIEIININDSYINKMSLNYTERQQWLNHYNNLLLHFRHCLRL